ncbi:hypothetical protein LAL4801_05420 [Roseibium aggregatum]|uniref:Uncharacterized protein n=1 Tax=Roseibium aggregatum TaxID=187304 RepID=A0A0M6YDS2_9HYPH|nr:hypothetical protein LAL4801_05420 [Roseibium aggregatum]
MTTPEIGIGKDAALRFAGRARGVEDSRLAGFAFQRPGGDRLVARPGGWVAGGNHGRLDAGSGNGGLKFLVAVFDRYD